MVEVIPAILVKTPEEFEGLLQKVEPHVKRVHLDIIDGEFAPNTTIKGYEELLNYKGELLFDIHLMVKNPAQQLEKWQGIAVADRIIIHAESEGDLLTMLEQLEHQDKRRALALNPETDPHTIGSLVPHVDFVQFMTVKPGFYGSPFVPEVLQKIELFHGEHPHAAIAVDGGITPETGAQACSAGASILISGSYIMNNEDISGALKKLQESNS